MKFNRRNAYQNNSIKTKQTMLDGRKLVLIYADKVKLRVKIIT